MIPQSVTLKQLEKELGQDIQKNSNSSIVASESSTIKNTHVVRFKTKTKNQNKTKNGEKVALFYSL
jgi:hypothetical protein